MTFPSISRWGFTDPVGNFSPQNWTRFCVIHLTLPQALKVDIAHRGKCHFLQHVHAQQIHRPSARSGICRTRKTQKPPHAPATGAHLKCRRAHGIRPSHTTAAFAQPTAASLDCHSQVVLKFLLFP
eukprot:CAMPEP_0176307778 /NCGR_PEP_ID=MMETSP0121_2-20121125/64199_1 /TAXON_ID=160619 /ORGANISM="Kryptoperidinium foliaceum, Strain CCMP 1326" /LENGTH=125 /DNA_ID=CAMNT_0017649581 /DNA_START=763 /DNA_END=1136 /DNA_ORIENTATION=+